MKKILSCVLLFQSLLPAVGRVSNVLVEQNPQTACVTVSYDLAEDAIVTLSVFTNGIKVADGCLRKTAGAVNREVSAGTAKKIFWFPTDGFSGHFFDDGEIEAVVTAWSKENPPDYMVADLTVTNCVRYYVSEDALPGDISDTAYKTDLLVMRRIRAAGKPWRMGVASHEKGQNGDETETTSIPHIVTLTNDYYIGVYEVTQRQYFRICGESPSKNKSGSADDGLNYGGSAAWPVENVSFTELRGTGVSWPVDGHSLGSESRIAKARALTGIGTLDLPTEAQWEYACRAGKGTSYNNGELCTSDWEKYVKESNLDPIAWYGKTSGTGGSSQHDVGLKIPNAWDLYDMHGNIAETCLDWYSEGDAYRRTFAEGWESGEPTLDPVGPESGSQHVYRGGSWSSPPSKARVTFRETWTTMNDTYKGAYYGFRFAAVIPVK